MIHRRSSHLQVFASNSPWKVNVNCKNWQMMTGTISNFNSSTTVYIIYLFTACFAQFFKVFWTEKVNNSALRPTLNSAQQLSPKWPNQKQIFPRSIWLFITKMGEFWAFSYRNIINNKFKKFLIFPMCVLEFFRFFPYYTDVASDDMVAISWFYSRFKHRIQQPT